MNNDATRTRFDQLVEEATALVQAREGWQDAYKGGTGQVLIELMASMIERVDYMLERRTQENYITTARLKTSIQAASNGLGYRPRRRTSSVGQLSITLTDLKGNLTQTNGDLIIDKYTPVYFEDRSFVVAHRYQFPPEQVYPTNIDIIEGSKREIVVNPADASTDLASRGYILLGEYEQIEENSLNVFDSVGEYIDVGRSINNEAAIESIAFAGPTERVYDIRVAHDGLRVYFGDGINGVKPSSPVTIQWIQSSGAAVSVLKTGLNFRFPSDELQDNVDVTPRNTYKYILTNSSAIVGGSEAETAEQIRQNAPDYVRTAGNAVVKGDFEFWLMRSGIGNVVEARCYGEQETGIDVYNMNNVYITYLTADGNAMTPTTRRQAIRYLSSYATITTKPVLRAADIFSIAYTLDVKRNSQLPIANSALYELLKDYFADKLMPRKGSLGKSVIHADMVRDLMDMKTVFNGKTYSLIERADLTLKRTALLKPIFNETSHSLTVTYGQQYFPYVLKVDDQTIQIDDKELTTANQVALAIKAKIESDSDEYVVNVTAENITISRVDGGAVQISFLGTGSEPATGESGIKAVNARAYLPFNTLKVEHDNEVFEPNSIVVYSPVAAAVIATDDGSGNLSNGSTVDYVTGEVRGDFEYANGMYVEFDYVGEEESVDIEIPLSAAAYVAPVKDRYSDQHEKLSRIVIHA